MDKCQEFGMDVKKFQFGRDHIASPGSFALSRFSQQSIDDSKPSYLYTIHNQPDKTYIDLKYLLTRAESILLRKNPHDQKSSSTLLKLSRAFTSVQTLPTAHNFRLHTKWGGPEKMKDWEDSLLTVARWLTYFDQFQLLPIDLRMKILTGVWHLWILFDRLAMNFLARKRGIIPDHVFIAGHNVYVDPNNLSLDLSWMTNYERDSLSFFTESVDWNMLGFIQPLMDLNPNNVELTFMISQLCLNYVGQRFQGAVLEISEKFQQILENDLHKYYVHEKKLLRYSGRLAQLMKFVRSVESNIREKRWKVKVGETFDVWKIQVSHPEVFEDNFC